MVIDRERNDEIEVKKTKEIDIIQRKSEWNERNREEQTIKCAYL